VSRVGTRETGGTAGTRSLGRVGWDYEIVDPPDPAVEVPGIGLDAALGQRYLQARVLERRKRQVDSEEDAGRSPFLVGHLSSVTFCQVDRKYPDGYFSVAFRLGAVRSSLMAY
jgi:hypothetical protein